MKTFTIKSISDNRVIAREVNPLGEKPSVKPEHDDPLNKLAHKIFNFFDKDLKEYELTGIVINDTGYQLWNDKTLEVGQTIQGIVVQEEGIDKIKVI